MSSFFVELWESIFVPGPTPTILRATNATFAALQVTLLALLVSTYSIHFVILSVLSAGLWYSINWFAAELAAAKARGDIPSGGDQGDGDGDGGSAADDEKEKAPVEKQQAAWVAAAAAAPAKAAAAAEESSDDTEVESRPATKKAGKRGKKGSKAGGAGRVAVPSADVEVIEKQGELKHRVTSSLSDSTGFTSQSSVSTEDEWEKVSESENDKTK